MTTAVLSSASTDLSSNNEKSVKYSDNFRRMILQINPHSISCTYKESFEQHSITSLSNAEIDYELFNHGDESQTSTNDSFFATSLQFFGSHTSNTPQEVPTDANAPCEKEEIESKMLKQEEKKALSKKFTKSSPRRIRNSFEISFKYKMSEREAATYAILQAYREKAHRLPAVPNYYEFLQYICLNVREKPTRSVSIVFLNLPWVA